MYSRLAESFSRCLVNPCDSLKPKDTHIERIKKRKLVI